MGLHGCSVVLMGRRQQFLDEAVSVLSKQNIKAASVSGDVRKEEEAARAVTAAVEAFGGLDILVNSAAGNFLAVAEELRVKGFRTVLDIDTVGVFNMSRACFEELKKSKRGVIVNISATLHYGATWYQV